MANIAVFLPRHTILECAERVIKEENYEVNILKVVDNSNTVMEARAAVAAGAQIIIARGLQAMLIKEATNVPVVEVRMTTQEIGLMVLKAKHQLKKECPQIAVVGFQNMFGDMEHLEELFNFRLRLYLIGGLQETRSCVTRAIQEGADLVIGGVNANQVAMELGFPCLFVETREDSIRNALDMAGKMAYAADLEQHSEAQLETILDTSFNGIIKLNAYREIVAINRMVEQILEKRASEVAGFPIEKVLDGIDAESIGRILSGDQQMYSTSLRINNQLLMILGAPIRYGQNISGAILTCHRIKTADKPDKEKLRELYLGGHVARRDFLDVLRSSAAVKQSVALAKSYALSANPILICGETGTETELFAECIHNNSPQREGPFLTVNLSAVEKEDQRAAVFGIYSEETGEMVKKGVLEFGTYGTVVLQEIDCLTRENQYLLYQAVSRKAVCYGEAMVKRDLSVRVIATTGRNLVSLVQSGQFRADLYYLLCALKLELPSLRESREDILPLTRHYIQKYAALYSTYVELEKNAEKVMEEYGWKGNIIQLEHFCERVVLTAQKRKVDEGFIRQQLSVTYPVMEGGPGREQAVILKNPDAASLEELLAECKGSRTLVAQRLGISTTTLWRRMKKYGITSEPN